MTNLQDPIPPEGRFPTGDFVVRMDPDTEYKAPDYKEVVAWLDFERQGDHFYAFEPLRVEDLEWYAL